MTVKIWDGKYTTVYSVPTKDKETAIHLASLAWKRNTHDKQTKIIRITYIP